MTETANRPEGCGGSGYRFVVTGGVVSGTGINLPARKEPCPGCPDCTPSDSAYGGLTYDQLADRFSDSASEGRAEYDRQAESAPLVVAHAERWKAMAKHRKREAEDARAEFADAEKRIQRDFKIAVEKTTRIEELEAALSDAREALADRKLEIADLFAENTKLREALERFADQCDSAGWLNHVDVPIEEVVEKIKAMGAEARKALSTPQKEGRMKYEIWLCPECGVQQSVYEPPVCGKHINDPEGEHYPRFVRMEVDVDPAKVHLAMKSKGSDS